MARRFWTSSDVVRWITEHEEAILRNPDDSPEAAAIWWVCYRDTEVLIDDTVRHIAQAAMEGIGPYDIDDVTNRLQSWPDEHGDEGDLPGIDDAIEEDLRSFFGLPATDTEGEVQA